MKIKKNKLLNVCLVTLYFTINLHSQTFIRRSSPCPDINFTWNEITTATGRIWMDRNLGATQVATSGTDANAFGDLYQWGRLQDGHQCRVNPGRTTLSSTSNVPGHSDFILTVIDDNVADWRTPQNNSLWQGISGANNPCPSGFRIPTEAEFTAETLTWGATNNGFNGGAFTALKLTGGGYRSYAANQNGLIANVGISGDYWTSTSAPIDSFHVTKFLRIRVTDNFFMFGRRAQGLSVRCIKN